MNHHDLIDNNLGETPCPADAKPDANGLSSTDASQPTERATSSNVQEQLLQAVQTYVLQQAQTNQLLAEICQQNAMLIGMIATDSEDDEPVADQYLDGSRMS